MSSMKEVQDKICELVVSRSGLKLSDIILLLPDEMLIFNTVGLVDRCVEQGRLQIVRYTNKSGDFFILPVACELIEC